MRAAIAALVLLAAGSAAAADGKALFESECAACHSPDGPSTAAGPSLKGIVWRRVASRSDFDYSPALKRMIGAWSPERLDAFLKNTQAFAPGNGMTFDIQDDADRRAIVDYLKTLK